MNWRMRAVHRVAHWVGWNHGNVECWFDRESDSPRLMVGFRCKCGELQDAGLAQIERQLTRELSREHP